MADDDNDDSNAVIFTFLGLLLALFLVLFAFSCAPRLIRWRRHDDPQDSAAPGFGLDPSAIASLPSFPYRLLPSSDKDVGDGGEKEPPLRPRSPLDCPICLLAAAEGEQMRPLPPCGHVFHAECVDLWLATNSKCPLCRRDCVPSESDGGRPLDLILAL